jgi:hypothetical protein
VMAGRGGPRRGLSLCCNGCIERSGRSKKGKLGEQRD